MVHGGVSGHIEGGRQIAARASDLREEDITAEESTQEKSQEK